MKFIVLFFMGIICVGVNSFAQDSSISKFNNWLTENNFAIRQTFDGSKNENKPASISFIENYETDNDYLNLDLAFKLSELELMKNSNSVLIFYPKVEWHKSNDSTDLKNKIDGGVNFEYLPFGLKMPEVEGDLINRGLIISPWFQGTSSYKRNIIDKVNEVKIALQVSLVSNYKFLPGYIFRDRAHNFRARYYPYLGIEYYYLPNLVSKGVTEEFSSYFLRVFSEIWIIRQALQLNIDVTYREIINNRTTLRTSLPLLISSLYFYPGKQESIGLGVEYKYGYDNNSKFQLVQISALKVAWKI